MKKSIFNVALLAMLFVLGACSVAPTVPGGTGDEVVDGGLSDALDQIGGDADGMQAWSVSDSGTEEGLTYKGTSIMYLSTTKFKNISTSIYDGTLTDEDGTKVTFDNEVVIKDAREGTLVITADANFKLVDNTGAVITDKKSYTSLYAQTSTKGASWESKKVGGTDAWVNAPAEDLGTSYYIVSIVADKLSMIYVQKTETEGTYQVYNFEESVKSDQPYTKK